MNVQPALPLRQAVYWLPLLLVTSVAAWALLPTVWMRQGIPWGGALALVASALALRASVRRARTRLTSAGVDESKPLRRATGRLRVTLYSMPVIAAFYGLFAGRVLSRSVDSSVLHLLWGLPVGGLVLTLQVCAWIDRLVDALSPASPVDVPPRSAPRD